MYVAENRSLSDVDAVVAFAVVIECGMSAGEAGRACDLAYPNGVTTVPHGRAARHACCSVIVTPMKDPDVIAAGITVILALVIALALRVTGIAVEAPLR